MPVKGGLLHRLIRFSLLAGCLVPALAVAFEPVFLPTDYHTSSADAPAAADSHQLGDGSPDPLGKSFRTGAVVLLALRFRSERIQDVTHCEAACRNGS